MDYQREFQVLPCPLIQILSQSYSDFILSYLDKTWINDLSIGSTETEYIKLNTKTQNMFCCVNENLTTFLYRGDKKTEGEKSFILKVYTKVTCYF